MQLYAQYLVKKNVWFAEWNLSKIIIRRKKIWDFYSIHTKISSSQHNELLNSFYQSIFKNLHTYYIFALLCSSPTFWKMSYLLTTKKHALLKGYWKNSTLWESFQLLSLATPLGLVFVYILYRGWLVESSSNNNNTHGTRLPPPRPRRECRRRRRFLHLDTLEREVLGQQRDAVCATALRSTRYVNIGVLICWSVCEWCQTQFCLQ